MTFFHPQCETFLEDYEELIEEWYSAHQDKYGLQHYLCQKHVLPKKEQGCLHEKGETQTNVHKEL